MTQEQQELFMIACYVVIATGAVTIADTLINWIIKLVRR